MKKKLTWPRLYALLVIALLAQIGLFLWLTLFFSTNS